MKRTLVLLMLLCALCAVRAALAEGALICRGESVWISEVSDVIDDPLGSPSVLGTLPAGAEVMVLDARGDWVCVQSETDESLRGFVPWNALRYDRVHALDAADLALEPGYEVIAGTWVGGQPETALLLVGNEEEDIMRLAVAAQPERGVYRVVARSGKILSYEAYRAGLVDMADHMNDGFQVYFWYVAGTGKEIYLSVRDVGDNDWRVTNGYVTDEAEGIYFCFTYDPVKRDGVMVVYDSASPQICWPIEGDMAVEGFDLPPIREACLEAITYLHAFSNTHRHGEQDETYRILWDADNDE